MLNKQLSDMQQRLQALLALGRQFLRSVAYLHSRQLVHYDIKLHNVVLCAEPGENCNRR